MRGWGPDGDGGLDPARVAEVIARDTPRGEVRGSGYRVTTTAVLTSAHVIAGAPGVKVRFNADRQDDERSYYGTVMWADRETDAAIVMIDGDDADPVPPARFGRIPDDDGDPIPCSAMGFPLFKTRQYEAWQEFGNPGQPYRDSCHLTGKIQGLSNRREQTLEIHAGQSPTSPDPRRSPWEGMSGAAVWSAGLIVGIVQRNDPGEGPSTLTASRIDQWYHRLDSNRFAELTALTGLPHQLGELPWVPAPTPAQRASGDIALSRALDHARAVGPASEVGLRGRDGELRLMYEFCQADGDPYLWWQAPPLSGKTALASWFVQYPPGLVRVASFFTRAGSLDYSDSDGYAASMIGQLASLAGQARPTEGGRDTHLRTLLNLAAARARADRCRLVLVIDGLDEDTSPRLAKAPIASLLPTEVPDGVRVIVTSRSGPGTGWAVPCRLLPLSESPYASEFERAAVDELENARRKDVGRSIIALLAAAEDGLTLRDLHEITQTEAAALDAELAGFLGRSVQQVTVPDPFRRGEPQRVVRFAHSVLAAKAAEMSADLVGLYRLNLDKWAERYQRRGWPKDTPLFLLASYPRLLAGRGRVRRFTELATDRARHTVMRDLSHTDEAALAEITMGRQVSAASQPPDLAALALLATEHDLLFAHNRPIPVGLPATWARLGDPARGEALARSIINTSHRADALTEVAGVIARTDPERALDLARALQQPEHRAKALKAVAHAASPGYARIAAAEAAEITDGLPASGEAESANVRAMIREMAARDPRAAVDFAMDPGRWPVDVSLDALATVIQVAVESGQQQFAIELAMGIEQGTRDDPDAMGALAPVASAIRPLDAALAERMITAVRASRQATAGTYGKFAPMVDGTKDVAALAQAMAREDPGRAERMITGLPDDFAKAWTAADIAADLLTEQPEWARRFAGVAHATARVMRSGSLAARAMAVTDPDGALRFASHVRDRKERDSAIGDVVRMVIARHPHHVRWCLAAARTIDGRPERGHVLATISAAAASSDPALVMEIAAGISDEEERAETLAAAAGKLAPTDPRRATDLASFAERTALAAGDFGHRQRFLAILARATAPVDHGLAERCLRHITNPSWRAFALAALVKAVKPTDPDKARDLALQMESADKEAGEERLDAEVIIDAVAHLPGQPATRLLKAVAGIRALTHDPFVRVTNLADQVKVFNALGRPRVARGTASRGPGLAARIGNAEDRARALAALAEACAPLEPTFARRMIEPAVESARGLRPNPVPPPGTADPDLAEMMTDAMRAIWPIGSGLAVTSGGIPWEVAALASVISALPPGEANQPLARWLADAAEHAARAAAGRDAMAQTLATVAEAIQPWDEELAVRLAGEAAHLLEHVRTFESADAAARISAVASRERHGDRTLLAISSQALARALAGPSWLDALPAVALLAPEDMRTICRTVVDQADKDAKRAETAGAATA